MKNINKTIVFSLLSLTFMSCSNNNASKGTANSSSIPEIEKVPTSIYFFGGEIQIKGKNLKNVKVQIGDNECEVLSASDTEITCNAPALASEQDYDFLISVDKKVIKKSIYYKSFTQMITIAGTGVSGNEDGAGDVAKISGVTNDIYRDGNRIYFSDALNYKVRYLDLTNLDSSNPAASQVLVQTLTGSGTKGDGSSADDSSDDSGASAKLIHPDGLMKLNQSEMILLEADWYIGSNLIKSAVRKINTTTGKMQTLSDANNTPKGISSGFVKDNFLYMSECQEHGNMKKMNLETKLFTDFAGEPGVWEDRDGVGLEAGFNCAWGVDFDAKEDSIYVASYGGYKVRKINLQDTEVTTVAGNGDRMLVDHANNPLSASFDNLGKIKKINHYLIVADMRNYAIRVINLNTGEVSSLMAGMGDEDGNLDQAKITDPQALDYHPEYGIFIGSSNWGSEPIPKIRLIH